MSATTRKQAQFTGRHMLAIMLSFFGVIVAVNLVMATFASTSWTGLVVKNSYVASQQFNRKAEEGRQQAALGWTGKLTIADGAIRYALADRSGAAVAMREVQAFLRRPAYEGEDHKIMLQRVADGVFAARHFVRDGIWIVEIDADTSAQKPYRDVRRVVVAEGAVQ
jgi:nitrogen fixation protein FixH